MGRGGKEWEGGGQDTERENGGLIIIRGVLI